MNKHILFLHIPKTAGTSFRKTAEIYFGVNNTFYDYTLSSSETSEIIVEKIYEENDFYLLYSYLHLHSKSFLSGHFPIEKYSSIYNMTDIVTFLRDPVDQVISHYNHFKNHNGYEKSLREFVSNRRFRNVQSKYLKEIHNVKLIGFIGLTEEYNTSIEMFNSQYNVEFPYMRVNERSEGSLRIEDISREDIETIKKFNEKDVHLYNLVKKQFFVRKKLFYENLPYTYGIIQQKNSNSIRGIAYQRENDVAVEIDIFYGKNYLTTVKAKDLRPGFISKNLPRKCFVGFEYTHDFKKDEKEDNIFYAFVKETGQEIL